MTRARAARTVAPSTRNVLKIFRSADAGTREAGREWYRRAYRLACELAGATDGDAVTRAAAVIAVLSPQCPWQRNVDLARQAYMLASDGADVEEITAALGCLKSNARKAATILAGADPDLVVSGPKVRAFWRTIVDPSDPRAVVVDRHAVDVAVGRVTDDATRGVLLGRKGGYAAVADVYARAAKILTREARAAGSDEVWHPSEVQAVTWSVWRRDHGHAQARAHARAELAV